MKSYTREELNDTLNKVSSMNYIYEIRSEGNSFLFEKLYKRTKNGIFQYYDIKKLYIICECDKNNYTDMCHITSFNLNNVSDIRDNYPNTISIYVENERFAYIIFSDKRISYIRNNILSFFKRILSRIFNKKK